MRFPVSHSLVILHTRSGSRWCECNELRAEKQTFHKTLKLNCFSKSFSANNFPPTALHIAHRSFARRQQYDIVSAMVEERAFHCYRNAIKSQCMMNELPPLSSTTDVPCKTSNSKRVFTLHLMIFSLQVFITLIVVYVYGAAASNEKWKWKLRKPSNVEMRDSVEKNWQKVT